MGDISGAIGLGSQVLGGLGGMGGADAAGNATNAQLAGIEQATQLIQKYGQQAIDTLNQQYGKATTDTTNYYNTAQTNLQPFQVAGLNALDQYLGTTGTPQVVGGSFFLQQALNRNNQFQQDLAAAKAAPNKAQTDFENALKGIYTGTSPDSWNYTGSHVTGNAEGDLASLKYSVDTMPTMLSKGLESPHGPNVNADGTYDWSAAQWGNPIDSRIMSTMQSELPHLKDLYSKYKNGFAPNPLPENPLSADQQAIVDAYTSGNLPMKTESGTDALKQFFNTPEYQLLYGNSAEAMDPSLSPVQRFQQDPGYQFQLQQGEQAINASAAAQGYANSPRVLQQLQTYGQGLANMGYSKYQGQLASVFDAYQNRLAALAGVGANMAGASSGNSMAQGTNLGNIDTGLGNQVSNVDLQMGSSLANGALAAGQARASGFINQQNGSAADAASLAGVGNVLGKSFAGPGTKDGGNNGGFLWNLFN